MFECIVAIGASIAIAVVVILNDQHIISNGAMIMLLCISCSVLFGLCNYIIIKFAFIIRHQTQTIAPTPRPTTTIIPIQQATKKVEETQLVIIPDVEKEVCIGRSSSNEITIIINPCFCED